MEVTLYKNFSKRRNSTKQINQEGVTKDIKLKDKCSYINPSFFIGDVEGYVYLKAWNNYYHIDKVDYDINGAQYITCSLDFLATWKDIILSTTAFVEYSTSEYNTDVIDNRIAHKVTKSVSLEVEETIFRGTHDTGCYCLASSGLKYGSTGWIIRSDRFIELIDELCSAGSDIWQSLVELFGDAVGAIHGARYMPIPYTYFDESQQDEIVLGDWNTGVQGIPTDGYVYDVKNISIPWIYSDFRRCSEFTRFILALPFVGSIDITPENIIGYNSLNIEMTLSMITGQCAYGVWARGESGVAPKLVGEYNCSVGRQVPVATDQINAQGFLGGVITSGTSAYMGLTKNLAFPLGLGGYGGGMLAAAGVIAGAAAATIAANKQDFVTIGGYDGCASEVIFNSIYLYCIANECQTTPEELTDLYGRPCMKVLNLSNLTGYVKTLGFSIDISAIGEIKNLINDAMDSGVYLE